MLKLSDLTERSDPQQGELERNVTRDVLENRLFWAVGESKEVQALALAALRTTLKQALTALQRYYEAYHARYHTQQVGKEEKPSKNLTHLGIPGKIRSHFLRFFVLCHATLGFGDAFRML